MKKFLFAVLAGIFAIITVNSQPGLQWESRFNGPGAVDKGNVIALDEFGNIYVAGVSDAANFYSDYLLIKYNPDGDTLWTRRYNGSANLEDVPLALKIDDNNNVYVTGKSKGAGTEFDIVTIKYNAAGVQQWLAVYNGGANLDDVGFALEVDVAGNVYVVGSSYYNVGSTATDGVVIKYNAAGTQLWKINSNQSSANEVANLISINKNNGNLIVAVGIGMVGDGSYRLLELTPSTGNVVKTYNYSFPVVQGFPDAMVLDGLGNIFVTSTFSQFGTPNYVYTAKFNYGVTSHAWEFHRYTSYWERQFHGIDLKSDVNSNLYVLYSYYNGQYFVVITEKLNAYGSSVWNMNFNSFPGINDYAVSLNLGSNETSPDVFVTSYSSNGDVYAIKYLNNGDLAWTISYDCGNNGVDVASSLAIDSSENLYLTGYSSCNGTYQDIKTIKYCTTVPEAVITANGATSFCPGGSVQLSADTCTGCTYLWSPNEETTPTITAHPTVTTDFTVEVTSPADCSAISDPFTVTVLAPPVITITGDTNICEGESTILSANGATNYSWWPTTGVSNPNIQNPVFTPDTTQIYTVAGNSPAGCPGSAAVTITVTPLPDVSIQGDNTICLGESTQLTATGATTYSWSPATGLDNPYINNPVATPSTTTTYVMTGTTNGCSGADTITITVVSVDVTLSGNTVLCKGDTIFNLIANGAETCSWFPETGLSDPHIANPQVYPSSTITYYVTGTTSGCTDQASVTITVKPKPDVSASGTDSSICAGESVQLTASGAPAYSWAPTQGLNNPNIQNPVATPSTTTTYVVTGTLNGCTDTAWVTVTVTPIPFITLAGPTYPLCPGEEAPLFAYSDVPIDTWLWEPAGSLDDPAISNPIATPFATTTYVATGTANECQGSVSYTVTVTPLPGQPGAVTGSTSGCPGDTEVYSVAEVAGATSYNWTLPPGWTGTSESHSITVVLAAGNGEVSVTAENECGQSDPRILAVTVYETPEKPTISQNGNEFTSDAPEGNQWYKWQGAEWEIIPGETGQTFTALEDGDYTVKVTLNGCSSDFAEPVTDVAQVSSESSIKVFPNPTQGTVYIQGISSNNFSRLTLSNPLGQVVMEERVFSENKQVDTRLDLEGLPTGMYFLTLYFQDCQLTYLIHKN